MTIQELSTAPGPAGAPSLPATSWRSKALETQVLSELKAAIATCLADAAAKGYTREELAASYLGGPQKFEELASGAAPSLVQATELARVCGFRLRISVEVMDDEVQASPGDISTPFEVASQWMARHVKLRDLSDDDREETLRQILAHYFGQMRERGLYLAQRK